MSELERECRLVTTVMKDRRLSRTAQAAFGAIVQGYAVRPLGKTTPLGDAWLSVHDIAERCGVTPRTVRRAIRQLERSEYIAVIGCDAPGRVSRYCPNMGAAKGNADER